jgi:hypothetical protein
MTLPRFPQPGTWYAASAGWNDPRQAVEESKPIGLMQCVLYLLGKNPPMASEKKPGESKWRRAARNQTEGEV